MVGCNLAEDWASGGCLDRRLMRSTKRIRCISVVFRGYFGISFANPSLSAFLKVPPLLPPFPSFWLDDDGILAVGMAVRCNYWCRSRTVAALLKVQTCWTSDMIGASVPVYKCASNFDASAIAR